MRIHPHTTELVVAEVPYLMTEAIQQMSIESGAGNQRSHELVEERRARAYSMYLKGFSEEQIAESLHVNQSTISRALAVRRRENVALFGGAEGENFLQSFLQEEKDRYLDLLQEEWNHYYSIVDNNVKGRIQALSVIRATLAAMSNMSGRLVAELDTLRMNKKVEELLGRVKVLGQEGQGRISHPASSSCYGNIPSEAEES